MESNSFERILNIFSKYSCVEIMSRTYEWCADQIANNRYDRYIKSNGISSDEIQFQKNKRFEREPLISIVVPAYETPSVFLRELIDSVIGQTYAKFELIIADGSSSQCVYETVCEYTDERIKYHKISNNMGISSNTNEGLKVANGDYVALLDHDDVLTVDALYEVVNKINNIVTFPVVIYSDEDKLISESGKYVYPNNKPDYNEAFFRCNNYVCHFLVFSQEILEEIGGLNPAYDGAQDFEFLLRCRARGYTFEHIGKVLYHWRCHAGSTALSPESKLYAYENGKKAIDKYLREIHEEGQAIIGKDLGFYRIDYKLSKSFKVAVYAYSDSQINCLRKLQEESENIVVKYINVNDINSTQADLVIEIDEDADYVLLLTPNIYPMTKNWITAMVKDIQMKDTGACVVKIVNAMNRVMSSGFDVNSDGTQIVLNRGLPRHCRGINHRADWVQSNVWGDEGKCMLVSADIIRDEEFLDLINNVHDRRKSLFQTINNMAKSVILDPDVVVRDKRIIIR